MSISKVQLWPLGAGACWAIYILTGQRAGAEHGPATVAIGSLIAAMVFVPIGAMQAGEALWHWSVIPLGFGSCRTLNGTALLTGDDCPYPPAHSYLWYVNEYGACAGGNFRNDLLGETLTLVQLLALGAIIAASMGSTLTMRQASKIKEIDVN